MEGKRLGIAAPGDSGPLPIVRRYAGTDGADGATAPPAPKVVGRGEAGMCSFGGEGKCIIPASTEGLQISLR